jgi:hypothetical protein
VAQGRASECDGSNLGLADSGKQQVARMKRCGSIARAFRVSNAMTNMVVLKGKFSDVAPSWRRFPATKRSNSEDAEAVRFRAATNRIGSFLWNVSGRAMLNMSTKEQR